VKLYFMGPGTAWISLLLTSRYSILSQNTFWWRLVLSLVGQLWTPSAADMIILIHHTMVEKQNKQTNLTKSRFGDTGGVYSCHNVLI